VIVLVAVGVSAFAWLALGFEFTEFEAEVASAGSDVAGTGDELGETWGSFLASVEDGIGAGEEACADDAGAILPFTCEEDGLTTGDWALAWLDALLTELWMDVPGAGDDASDGGEAGAAELLEGCTGAEEVGAAA
jgi:hypothetical protein